ncbi:hypothetical protein [Paraliobacillus sediminis]|uniref:hypothetical protein n=1 Tax=Paraliobacillus sediminis TaxID=1885916 RepID=UPI0013C30B7F|nr:hypothetical protein [Paraliobacillus sediminis]
MNTRFSSISVGMIDSNWAERGSNWAERCSNWGEQGSNPAETSTIIQKSMTRN